MLKVATAVYVGPVTLDRIIDLRHRILRAGLPIETAYFQGDEDLHTTHYAAFLTREGHKPMGRPVGCATFMLNLYDKMPAWQLRGMATEEAYQGTGVGRQLLGVAERELASNPLYAHVETLWCHARVSAIKFYERSGWRRVSEVFDIPNAGPHVTMIKSM